MGLESINRCIILQAQTVDMQHLTSNHTSILWPHTASTDTHGCKWIWMGAALIQNNCSIAFASKTLTDMEIQYVNIECECLAVVFRLEKFHTYIFRCYIIVYNDHMHLEIIQKKPIHAAPSFTEKATKTKNRITTSYISQEKDWSWQTDQAGSPQGEKVYK